MKNVIELADVGAPNLWGHIKDEILEAYDELWGRRAGGEVMEIHGGGIKGRRRQFQEK